MTTQVLWGSPLYLADGYCSIYSIHGASDQVAMYTASDCVTNFAHAQLSCFYPLSTQNATKWRSRPRPSPGLKLHWVKGQSNACAGRGPGNEAIHAYMYMYMPYLHVHVHVRVYMYTYMYSTSQSRVLQVLYPY